MKFISLIICVILIFNFTGCRHTVSNAEVYKPDATLSKKPEMSLMPSSFNTIGVAQVAKDGYVYAYKGKDTSSRIIGTAVNGVRFAVVEQTDSWCEVIYDGETAYIPSSKLKVETASGPLPQHTAYYVIPAREEIGYVYKAFNNKLVIKCVSYKDNKNTQKRLDIYKSDGTLLVQDAALVIEEGTVSSKQDSSLFSVTVKNGKVTKCKGITTYTDEKFDIGSDTGKVISLDKSVIVDNQYWETFDVTVKKGTVYNAAASIDIEPSYYFEPKVLPDELVDVRRYTSGIEIDMVFAKDGNVLGDALYEREVCLLQKGTAEKLQKAQDIFAQKGYSIVIYDAYRPHSVTVAMYEKYKNPTYVSRPKFGSDHNRGAAVDMSLIDKDGNPVEMPSPIHTFSSASHRDSKMSRKAESNMNYMAKVMKSCGFKAINSEWWHFSDTDALKYLRTDHDLNNIQRIILE